CRVFMLHSNMQTLDQENVLKTPPSGIRKIAKVFGCPELCYSVKNCVDFKSQCCPEKRELNTSYVKTSSSLYELCLHTELLAPVECPVADFLKKAPTPPPALIVTDAFQMLKQIDAMDVWEDLTELSYHLAKLHVEPHLGAMVLCAVVLECLDPVLTIACAFVYRDPFVLPALAFQKRAAVVCRKELAEGTFSDHMVLLRAFQKLKQPGLSIALVRIPPSNGQAAALQTLPADWLVYDEMTRAHRIANIRRCSAVTPVTVALFSGPASLPHHALPRSFVKCTVRNDRYPDLIFCCRNVHVFFYVFNSGNRESSNDDSDRGMEDDRYNMALLKRDEWLRFNLDPDVSNV
ncbi:hypothetical protein ASZ78_015138, partial [Callipepla squamata]